MYVYIYIYDMVTCGPIIDWEWVGTGPKIYQKNQSPRLQRLLVNHSLLSQL